MKEQKRTGKQIKEHGITLIALIITIIVLAIIAVITIYSIVQMNMIEKAISAIEKYENEQQRESNMMSSTDVVITEIGNEGNGPKVEVGREAEEQATINGKRGTYQNPTIPKGYYPMNTESAKWDKNEGPEYSKGLVITDAVDSTGKSTGNEWVWVPVQNPREMYEEAEEEVAITGGEANAINNVSTTRYSKLEILIGIDRVLPNDTSNFREPDVVVGNGTQYDAIQANRIKAGFTTLENMATTLISEYNTMIDSVTEYGGFYLGRYELTANGEMPGTPLTNTDWYDLYAKCKTLSKSGSNTMTRMVWGNQWDMTCKWLSAKYNINNSKDWGIYNHSTVTANDGKTVIKPENTSTRLDTGITTYTMTNNLYDMAGNVWELTQEAYKASNRTSRGGSYYNSGDNVGVSNRGRFGSDEASSDGLRYALHFDFETCS